MGSAPEPRVRPATASDAAAVFRLLTDFATICQRSRTPVQSDGGDWAFQCSWSDLMGRLTMSVRPKTKTRRASAATVNHRVFVR